jgi:hypothetical protein
MAIAELALDSIVKLIASAIGKGTGYLALSYLDRRRVERSVEASAAAVVETIDDFLANEGVSEEDQRILIHICIRDLTPLTVDPHPLFSGSLSGRRFSRECIVPGFPWRFLS